jgi:hypothetical protein
MFCSLTIREKAAQLLAADASTLAPATDANVIALVKAPIAPGEGLLLIDITLADFDGSTPIDVGTGTQPEALDPNTADAIISLLPPAGGFRFETTGITNLPQTIYGYVLLNNAMTKVYASESLATPITLTAINQVIELGTVHIRQLAGSFV